MVTKPVLAYWQGSINHLEPLRELTDEELEQNNRFAPIFLEAANRFTLFHLLRLNHEAWRNFTDSLLSPHPDEEIHRLRANQLLFNLLASGYGITEHFNVSIRQKFKKEPEKIKEYEDFLDRLCAGSWAVAFFFDFRNYVQHVGLPVGNFHRSLGRTKVEVTIEHDAAVLLSRYRDWKRSKLDANHGKIDLVELSFEYYMRLRRDYAIFLTKLFYPVLAELEAFYTSLTQEATGGDRSKRMIVITKLIREGPKLDFTATQPPNYPLEELGILVDDWTKQVMSYDIQSTST